MAQPGLNEVLQALGTIVSAYPLDFPSTLALFYGGEKILGFLFAKQFDKAAAEAYKVGMETIGTALSEKQTRDHMIEAAWSVLPKRYQAFISDKQIEALVDTLFVSKVRVDAKEAGLIPSLANVKETAIKAANGRAD